MTSIFGIRHHGPGSARCLVDALAALRPDIVLVEGPVEAVAILPLAADPAMVPPVAILIYRPDQPQRATFYPFAIFSPEWQAIGYALRNDLPLRFIDLPQAFQLVDDDPGNDDDEGDNDESQPPKSSLIMKNDPLRLLAEAAGFTDGELWWEQTIEHRRRGDETFAAIAEAMGALRKEAERDRSGSDRHDRRQLLDQRREAFMREEIRRAQGEGYQRIAVVCGAWHVPALSALDGAKSDRGVLKGLPRVKVEATWVPWTHGRLSADSGYGAGVRSPGWYHHLWTSPDNITTRWMARVAGLLRREDLDASPAQVIEAVRLAETLAALRGSPLPGLQEMNDAVRSTLCFGSDLPMRLVERDLVIGEAMGRVPDTVPTVPLQRDLEKEQKRLRMPPSPLETQLDLDLRKPLDLDRSRLLHRLVLLGIPWGSTREVYGKKGTFHEIWDILWKPEFLIAIIEASVWGGAIDEAAAARSIDTAAGADIVTLSRLLERVMLADLPSTADHVTHRMGDEGARAGDLSHLMLAIVPLAGIMRYGNVRATDTGMVASVVAGFVSRICIGLPLYFAGMNEEAAEEALPLVIGMNDAIGLLTIEQHEKDWIAALRQIALRDDIPGLIAGRASRILLDRDKLDAEQSARMFGRALSTAGDPARSASWIAGFLGTSGAQLIHDEALWQILDRWLCSLSSEAFVAVLPIVRRTMASFTPAERRQLGDRVRREGSAGGRLPHAPSTDIDPERAGRVLPLIAQLLAIPQ